MANLAIDALAAELGIARERIAVQSVTAVDWGDSSLGCPRPDMAYLSVVTPGHRVTLLAEGKRYSVHEANNRAFVCRQPQPGTAPGRSITDAAQLPFREQQRQSPEVEVPEEDRADRPMGNFEPSNSDTAPVDSDEPEKPDPKP